MEKKQPAMQGIPVPSLIPGLGGSHVPRNNQSVCHSTEPVLQSPGATTTDPRSQSPHSETREGITMRSLRTQPERSPCPLQAEKACRSKRPSIAKNKNKYIKKKIFEIFDRLLKYQN